MSSTSTSPRTSRRSSTTSPRGRSAGPRCSTSSTGLFERALEKAEHSFERFSEELDETCPLCPTEDATPGSSRSSSGDSASSSAARNYPGPQVHPEHGRVGARPEPEMLDEDLPGVWPAAPEARRAVRAVRRDAAATRTARSSRSYPPRTLGITCPQCEGRRDCREADPVRRVLRVRPLPRPRLRREQRADQLRPRPTGAGPVLAQRPKLIRCWNCGAEFDLEFALTKEETPRPRPRRAPPRPPLAPLAPPRRRRRSRPPTGARSTARKATAKKTAATRKPTATGRVDDRSAWGGRASGVDDRRRGRRPPRDQALTLKLLLDAPGVPAASSCACSASLAWWS